MSPTSKAPTVPCTCSPTLFPTDRSEEVTAASPHRNKALGWLAASTSPAPLSTALLRRQDLALKSPGCFASVLPLFILETCRDKSLCLFAALVSPPGDPSLLVTPNIFHHPGLRGAPGDRSRHTGVCLARTELSGRRSLPYSPAVGGMPPGPWEVCCVLLEPADDGSASFSQKGHHAANHCSFYSRSQQD